MGIKIFHKNFIYFLDKYIIIYYNRIKLINLYNKITITVILLFFIYLTNTDI